MGDVATIITAVTALVALTGGYVQFVLRRALMPCIEFDVEFSTLNRSASNEPVGEVLCRIRNQGPGVGYVKKVQCRALYRLASESGQRGDEPNFEHRKPAEGYFFLDTKARFIQPGVTQFYRKPLVFDAGTCLIHLRAKFEYDIRVGRITSFLAWFFRQSREKNPIDYVVQRTYSISEDETAQLSGG
jgi:hypothetical protein